MSFLRDKKILLVSVKFMGYEAVIRQGLENLGANVVYCDERPSNSTWIKGGLRLWPWLIKKRIDDYYNRFLEKVSNEAFDYILIVKGEVIPPSVLIELRESNPNATVIIYLWDSLANSNNAQRLLPYADRVFSFDRQDCSQNGFTFRPMFFDYEDYSEYKRNTDSRYDLLFAGTLHTDRYKVVKKVSEALSKFKLKSHSFFYSQSILVLLFKGVFEKGSGFVKLSEVNFAPLDRAAYMSLLLYSKVLLDVHHPKQNGLTQRPFEALALSKKLITTNSSIKEYDFYSKNNIMIIDRANPQIDIDFFKTPFEPVNPEILKYYSIEGWLKTIFQAN